MIGFSARGGSARLGVASTLRQNASRWQVGEALASGMKGTQDGLPFDLSSEAASRRGDSLFQTRLDIFKTNVKLGSRLDNRQFDHTQRHASGLVNVASSPQEGETQFSLAAVVHIRNCLVASNQTCDNGGGIKIEADSTTMVYSCTIVANGSDRYGGICVSTNNCEVWNCVVVSNQADTYPDMRGTINYIAPVYYSCSPVLINAENSNITNAPVFVNCVAGNYRLSSGSPCINTGTNQDWMTGAKDLDEIRRIDLFSEKVDMGAYEDLPAGILFQAW